MAEFLRTTRGWIRNSRTPGDGFEEVENEASKGNPDGNPLEARTFVTGHGIDEAGQPNEAAFDRVWSPARSAADRDERSHRVTR